MRLTAVMRPIQPTVKRLRPDPEQAPRLVAAVAVRDPLLELDSEADDRELLARRHAEPDEVVAYLGADRDQRSRDAREPPLEQAESERAHRPEVAAQHVPVERVDDDRRPRVGGEKRRDAADRSGLRRVRMQDRRPLAPDQLRQSDDRDDVAHRRDVATEARQPLDLDAELVRDELHRVLAAREAPGDERRVVAALAEPV